ncbi:MAG: replication initiator protein A [Clostridiales bacterium]|nr:replication initiator protein A [Clostridiales bacterium]
MNQFFKLYKFLFEDEEYKRLSIESKVVYSIMIDRNELSTQNNLIDDKGQVYIFMTANDIQDKINCSKQTAHNILKELEVKNLIYKVRQGLGKPNKVYVQNLDIKKSKNHTSKGLKNRLQEVQNLDPNKTNINKTEYNKTEYNKTDINNKSGALAPDKEIVFQIPLKDSSYYNLNKQDVDTYKSLYPNINIEQEIKNIIGWNIANPSKRKTKKGIKKHINTWLSSSNQNKGGVKDDRNASKQIERDREINKLISRKVTRV